ncbi:MAG: hypothetical protein ACI4KA_05925 [Oscillospiraceae bacterium]
MAMLALAEQGALMHDSRSEDASMLLSNGIPGFAGELPENTVQIQDIAACAPPSAATGIPTAELSWFGG